MRMPPRERVAELFLFRNWGSGDLDWLARQGRFTKHRKGAVLFEAGEPCEKLLVLVDGQVQMFRRQPDGKRIPLHTVRAEALIACAALFLDRCYPASALVVSRMAEVFELAGRDFLALLERRPDLARKMISALATRLAELADRLESEHGLSAAARLARWLSEQRATTRQDSSRFIALQTTKRALADQLGMTPETLSRTIRHLVEHGAIRATRGGFLVVDSDRLLELAEASD